MSEVLVVSGGGRISVAGDDLLVAVGRCRLLAGSLDALALDVPLAAVAVRLRLGELSLRLRGIAVLTSAAVDGYSAAERGVARAVGIVLGETAYWAALLVPLGLQAVPPAEILAAVAAIAGGAAAGTADPRTAAAGRRLLSDPRFVGAVRMGSGAVDDAFRGGLRIPWLVSEAADDSATGLMGRERTTGTLLGALTSAGVLSPGPPTTIRVTREQARPPRSLADLADRLPPPVAGGPQLRIERYPGVTAVYLGGSVDLRLGASEEPWDLASNLAAVADAPADSVRAAADALAAAGVGPDDPIVLVGYSQGGLVASRLAASGNYRVAGMLTLGSPGSSIPVPSGIPVLELEHSEDLVPALAGPQRAEAPDRVTATRSLYDGNPPVSPLAVPAHQLDEYRETAALSDATGEQRIEAVRERLLAPFAGAGTGEAGDWRASRVSGAVCLPGDAGSGRGAR